MIDESDLTKLSTETIRELIELAKATRRHMYSNLTRRNYKGLKDWEYDLYARASKALGEPKPNRR